MKTFAAAVFSVSFFAFLLGVASADDRPSMVGPPPEEDAIKSLLEEISSACSNKDFRRFMQCFTPERASSIKGKAEDLFIRKDLKMEIVNFFVISNDEESVVFGLKYRWIEDSDEFVYSSKGVAKKCNGSWKLDSNEVRDSRRVGAPQNTNYLANNRPALPLPNANANPAFDAKPIVANPPVGAVVWRRPDPVNGGEESWLPKDIGYRPGPSCANGTCGIR